MRLENAVTLQIPQCPDTVHIQNLLFVKPLYPDPGPSSLSTLFPTNVNLLRECKRSIIPSQHALGRLIPAICQPKPRSDNKPHILAAGRADDPARVDFVCLGVHPSLPPACSIASASRESRSEDNTLALARQSSPTIGITAVPELASQRPIVLIHEAVPALKLGRHTGIKLREPMVGRFEHRKAVSARVSQAERNTAHFIPLLAPPRASGVSLELVEPQRNIGPVGRDVDAH